MSLVYGLSILVYQKGLFSSFHWTAIKNTGGLYWLIPVITVTILIGLALDYDVFLFARIHEYGAHSTWAYRACRVHAEDTTFCLHECMACL